MNIPHASHTHCHALDAFEQKHNAVLQALVNSIQEQAKAGAFHLNIRTDDIDEANCIYILKDYGYVITVIDNGFRISW